MSSICDTIESLPIKDDTSISYKNMIYKRQTTEIVSTTDIVTYRSHLSEFILREYKQI